MYDWDELAEWQREQPDRPATVNEAIDEYARNAGAMFPDRAWLSTSWDTWVQNPHYSGPPVPHPEEEH